MRAYFIVFVVIIVAAVTIPFAVQATAVPTDESYYVIVFAYEGTPNVARLAHSFATFVKVEEQEDVDPNEWPIEMHTISWLPATLDVRVLLRGPERGTNLDLQKTIELAASQRARITGWGPYRIKKDLYDRAVTQVERLNAAGVAYKARDNGLRPGVATNCFHAISDIVEGPLLNTGTAFGNAASIMVRDHLSPSMLENRAVQPWLITRLGLDKNGILFRE